MKRGVYMALIKCPECGKDISDKSSACIHCGYPLEKLRISLDSVKVDENIYNISSLHRKYNKYSKEDQIFIYKECKKKYKKITKGSYDLLDISTEYDSPTGQNLVQMVGQMFNWWNKNGKMYLTYKFLIECINHNFEYFEFNTADYAAIAPKPTHKPDPNIVRCPKCGSTSVTTQERGYSIMWGVLGSTKKKNLCQKCGYTWWPGGKK